jgi:hypothetical protein
LIRILAGGFFRSLEVLHGGPKNKYVAIFDFLNLFLTENFPFFGHQKLDMDPYSPKSLDPNIEKGSKQKG